MMKFRTILADPPWTYETFSPKGSRALDKYATQEDGWILSLGPLVQAVADRHSTLLLWATNPKLPEAFAVLEAWGFRYKSKTTWAKMSRAAAPRIGLGFHVRAATEELLIATRGEPSAPEVSRRPAGLWFCPPGEHSRKPDYQYDLAEGYAGPYLELFCRPRDGGLFGPRPHWTYLGDAVDGQDIRDALGDLAREEPAVLVEAA